MVGSEDEISFDRSWEKVTRDLVTVISDFPYLNYIAPFVVLVGDSGALSFSFERETLSWTRRLYYAPPKPPHILPSEQVATTAHCIMAGIVAHAVISNDNIELAWLWESLAPMWDAKYRIPNTEESFGKVIFVFAGGTTPTYKELEKVAESQPPSAKALDFKTRITFHLNIPSVSYEGLHPDNFALLRRAILIRSALERIAPSLVEQARTHGTPLIDPSGACFPANERV
jgi:hypothetical protein